MSWIACSICHMLKIFSAAVSDVIFATGQEGSHTFFVQMTGDLDYVGQGECILEPPPFYGEWLAEAALWTPWRYRGTCTARIACQPLSLDVDQAAASMAIHPMVWHVARQYAVRI